MYMHIYDVYRYIHACMYAYICVYMHTYDVYNTSIKVTTLKNKKV